MRCIVFDFDGTLVDSDAIKQQLFFAIFRDRRGARAFVRQALQPNRRLDRSGVVRFVVERLVDTGTVTGSDASRIGRALVRDYTRGCEVAVGRADEIAGSTQALRRLAGSYRLYVASATPQPTLRRCVAARNWTKYFRGIYGRPADKVEILGRICGRERTPASNMILVGNSEADRLAARQFGCHFVAVGSGFSRSLPKHRVPTMKQLPVVIGRIAASSRER